MCVVVDNCEGFEEVIFGIGMVGWTIYIGMSSIGSCVDDFISVV